MKKTKIIPVFIISLILIHCKSNYNNSNDIKMYNQKFNIFAEIDSTKSKNHDSTFANLKKYSSNFVFDMKYATKDNFLKTNVYDCSECYLRLKTVKALIEANKKAMKVGLKIKLFDCYRPLDVQKKMWAIVPNPKYVANPAKGSIHNKGGAVDISLVDKIGKELDMGTPFDFFGEQAAHSYQNLSDTIKNNRKLLKKIMEGSHFKAFESEWWHYNLENSADFKVSNFKWKCN